jgi:hypothetical protein
VNPINKVLLEALKRLVDAVDDGYPASIDLKTLGMGEGSKWYRDHMAWESVMNFARQAISEAEKGLGENLGSPVPKGSDTEVRGDSFLQALLDIQAEADDTRRDGYDRLHRITLLVHDLINAHLAKAEGR